VVPTVRLQRRLGGGEGVVRRHDLWLSWVHWSWFFVPHTTVAYVLWRRPEQFPRAAAQVAATFDLGCIAYWAVPTAPPWWAGKNGNLEPVRRIMVDAGEHYWGRLWRPLYDSLAGNPLAAMPSLHFGTSVTAAHVLSDVSPVHGAVGWAYAATLGFSLVYLGEHYVIDLLAGLALAEAVRLGARRL
jgi:membrane-associated phospholipid phosphatase